MKNTKIIRDLGIALTIVAGLCMLGSFLSAGAASFTQGFLGYYEPVYLDDYYTNDYGFRSGISILGSILGIASTLSLTTLVMSVPALVAGILAIRKSDDVSTMNSIFGWSLAGAICTGISGASLVCFLCIVICVFARQMKSAKTEAHMPPSAEPIDALIKAAEPEKEETTVNVTIQ